MKNISIIGAGIIGASIGFELAKNGARVTIVDREDLGQATKAAAGIMSVDFSTQKQALVQACNGRCKTLSKLDYRA